MEIRCWLHVDETAMYHKLTFYVGLQLLTINDAYLVQSRCQAAAGRCHYRVPVAQYLPRQGRSTVCLADRVPQDLLESPIDLEI